MKRQGQGAALCETCRRPLPRSPGGPVRPGDRFRLLSSGDVMTVKAVRRLERPAWWFREDENWEWEKDLLDPSCYRRLPRRPSAPERPPTGRRRP